MGSVRRPCTLYTDSLIVLAGATGRLLWHDQVTAHDMRDYDFQVSRARDDRRAGPSSSAPERAVGSSPGTASTHRRIWSRAVGTHLHDLGPLPLRPTPCAPVSSAAS